MSTSTSLKVLSLNCWGLKFVSKDRPERINAIAAALSASDYDVVALQELWILSDFELVRSHASKRLPYAKLFHSGALGAGLAILSRYPIIMASIRPYSLNGRPLEVAKGDWFVGKAAASVVIQHPILGEVEIFNTHFNTGAGDAPGEAHILQDAHRLINAWEFAKLARISANTGRYVIAAGDFNSIPESLPMRLISDHTGLKDAWEVAHGRRSSTTRQTDPHSAIYNLGVTADSPTNSYSAGKRLDYYARLGQGKRLDYIFYRGPIGRPERYRLHCAQAKVVFTDPVPGHNFSFSDHFGIEATIDISSPEGVLDESSESSVSEETSILMTRAFIECYRQSHNRSRLELSIFAACVVSLIILCIGSAWTPHPWITPFWILLTVILSWLGTTMLYSGFIYGNWERKTLTSVTEELELSRHKGAPRTNTIVNIESGQ